MSIWVKLDKLVSRGKSSGKAGSLGALHAHRGVTLSQFFTPAWVVEHAWQIIAQAIDPSQRYSVLDNSMGAASMYRCANPSNFELYGIDIDRELVANVIDCFNGSEFSTRFVTASMTDVKLGQFSIASINPPFSIQLDSQSMTAYEGITHFGKLGPNTSALSHEYALVQALSHCDIVAAVIPASFTQKIRSGEFPAIDLNRLRAVLHLPNDCFSSESVAQFKTDLVIFSKPFKKPLPQAFYKSVLVEANIDEHSPITQVKAIHCRAIPSVRPSIDVISMASSEPVIVTPPSDDKRVILRRAGRNIKLKFYDGGTEAKVLNRLMGEALVSTSQQRYPTATKYKGTYRLSIDVLVMQDDPFAALNQLCADIAQFGGVPVVDHQLTKGVAALMKEHKLKSTPFGRTVYRKGLPQVSGTANKTLLLNRTDRNSLVKKGEQVTASRTLNGYAVQTDKGLFECSTELFLSAFDIGGEIDSGYWEEIHAPLKASFPQEIAKIEKQAVALGLDKLLTMEYQLEDCYELALMGSAICGWEMALGKTRLEISLALLMKGTSLIVLKSRLIDEMMIELKALGVDMTLVNVIDSVHSARHLTKLNIISYETLRRAVNRKCEKFTYAHILKNNIQNLFADEGGCLTNTTTQQSVALYRVNAKNRIILDGTPCPNYPREMLALLHFVTNGAKSYMPYSNDANGIHYSKWLIDSAKHQICGRKAYLDTFSSFEWATNEFFDTGVGAKREVPKVNQQNLGDFRGLISPFLKRRVQQEPAVSKHIKFPVPVLHEPIEIEWDFNHLVQYVSVLEDFAQWFQAYQEKMKGEEKACSLVVVLARLEACFQACNVPQNINPEVARPFNALTSKERACIELVKDEVAKGRRPIVFAKNPVVLHRLGAELTTAGISNLVFTGEETIKQRTNRLNDQIRQGDTQVMLASLGVTQDGLNLHQLNTFVFYNRSYMARAEFQGIYRLVRPKQMSDVYGYFLHLSGSIDEYMGQLIEWKQLASEAGLDFGEQPEQEFKHFEHFIAAFLESIPALKEQIKQARNKAA